jgi:hypothetical protein
MTMGRWAVHWERSFEGSAVLENGRLVKYGGMIMRYVYA